MISLESIKKRIASTFTILIFAGFMAAGCASVTDANPDLNESEPAQTEAQAQESDSDTDPIWHPTNGDDMDPIIERPPHP